MTKYYFGYNKFNGNVFPVKWCEEEGRPVGGAPVQIMQRQEIDYHRYRNIPHSKLEREYPYIPETEEPKTKV